MTNHITCDQFADSLADLLEDDVAVEPRAALESHALACADCGSLLADLRRLRADATNLPELSPSRDLWSGVAARIDAPVIPIAGGRAADAGQRRPERSRWIRVSAAAAVLIAATAGITYYATMRAVGYRTPRQVAVASDSPAAVLRAEPIQPTASSLQASADEPRREPERTAADRSSGSVGAGRLAHLQVAASSGAASPESAAEATYGREIARLHAIIEQRRGQLDPATIGIVEKNLRIIDDAIAQCRAALAKDPASRFLMQSLNSALENKIELLRTAAMLPSRT